MLNKSKFNMSDMPSINKYLGISFSRYLLLTIITCGLYYIWFQYRLTRVLSDIDSRYTDKGKMVTYLKINLGLWVGSSILCITGVILSLPLLGWIGIFLFLCGKVIQKLWAYSARSAILAFCINHYEIYYTANPMLLFFFPGLTLTWAIDSIVLLAQRKYSV